MKQLLCEMCGSADLMKTEGVFVCQNCGMKYSVEEAKKMMIEGTVEVQGTVKVDNTDYIQKYLMNARRALTKEDWEEVEKYYNLVEQNAPDNMEAVFFSSYGKAMLAMTDSDYFKREQKFAVLKKSISVISDYYETTTENKEESIRRISEYIDKMYNVSYVYKTKGVDISVVGVLNALTTETGDKTWCKNLLDSTKKVFINELRQISAKHDDEFIKELLNKYCPAPSPNAPASAPAETKKSDGCYVATAVYGSYDCPQVWTLRRYRDYTLAETRKGRAFIKTYYAISPTLVKWFGNTSWFKKMWKGKLDRMVKKLQDQGVESTPYNDKNW